MIINSKINAKEKIVSYPLILQTLLEQNIMLHKTLTTDDNPTHQKK